MRLIKRSAILEWNHAVVFHICQCYLVPSIQTATVFESIIMKYVDDIVCDTIDSKQFGGIAGTSTTDALVEMTHRWYEATDLLNT